MAQAKREARREDHRLRVVVAQDRGCLRALTPQSHRLLDLRAGIGGRPHSAPATARILHVSAQRESLLEQASLMALSMTTASGCGASASGSEAASSAAATAVPAVTGGTLVASVPTLAGSSSASGASGAPVASAIPAAAGSTAVTLARAKPGSHPRPAPSPGPAFVPSVPATGTLSANSIVRAATVDHQAPVLAVIALALLLATVVLGQPWRRRRTAAATAGLADAGVGGAAAAAVADPAAPAASHGDLAPSPPAPQPRAATPTPARAVTPPPVAAAPARSARSAQPHREPWLREHATQAALLVTALAGIVARGRSGRARPGRRR